MEPAPKVRAPVQAWAVVAAKVAKAAVVDRARVAVKVAAREAARSQVRIKAVPQTVRNNNKHPARMPVAVGG